MNITKINNNEIWSNNSLAYVVRVSLVVAMGGLLFGYDTAVISGAIGFLRTKFELNTAMMGWTASGSLVGCIIGFFFVWKIIPETKGKSLEEIEKLWIKI